jgi:hypothetical protein
VNEAASTAPRGAEFGNQQRTESRVTRPLRVGLILDSFRQPAWICTLLERLRASTDARVMLVIQAPASAQPARPSSFSSRLRNLYARIDAARFGGSADALAERDAAPLLAEMARLPLAADDEQLESIGRAELDVALDVRTSASALPKSFPARFGAWRLELGEADTNAQGVHGFSEFASGAPTTTALLRRIDAEGAGAIVGRAVARTDGISLRRGMNRLCRKSVLLIERELARLLTGNATAPASSTLAPLAVHENKRIGTIAPIVRSAARYVVQQVRDRAMEEQWLVAFRFRDSAADPNDDYRRFHTIVPPRDRMWADPFVVNDGGRTWLFVEEMVFREGRGVLSVMELHRDGSWSQPRRILERPYHLSYPCVVRWNGHYYMLPESGENRSVELYRAVQFPFVWEPAAVVLHDTAAVDSTLFEHEGRWWMYTTTAADGEVFDELSLYFADSPLGPWTPHPGNPLLSDVVGGRCGGRPFYSGGRLLRAAQVGARRYGHSIQLREIVTLTPEAWEERVAGMIRPEWRRDLVGTHTLNVDGDVAVIDGVRHLWAIGT